MKKLLTILTMAICIIVSGCKTIPTEEVLSKVSTSIGYAAGIVAVRVVKVDDVTKEHICQVMDKVSNIIPNSDQSFSEVWKPIAAEHTKQLLDDDKISEFRATTILKVTDVAITGLDYLKDVRYPRIGEYHDLVAVAVKNFNSGFIKAFSPVDALKTEIIDIETFDVLSEKFGIK